MQIGDLVRVRHDAGELHSDNYAFEGQMGILVGYDETVPSYPYNVRFLATGEEYIFSAQEIELAPTEEQADGH